MKIEDASASKLGLYLPIIFKDIDQERIDRWACLSGDFNRLHVDPEYAKKTPFKGTIAHGPMSLAFLNELMMQTNGAKWVKCGRLLDVRFRAPIRPGERVKIAGSFKEKVLANGRLWAEWEVFIEKPNGEVAVTGVARLPMEEGDEA
ncbi:MAG: MaoC family dehydratase [Candidatus Hadarchaeum sp.]